MSATTAALTASDFSKAAAVMRGKASHSADYAPDHMQVWADSGERLPVDLRRLTVALCEGAAPATLLASWDGCDYSAQCPVCGHSCHVRAATSFQPTGWHFGR